MTLQVEPRYRIMIVDDSVTFLQAVIDLIDKEPKLVIVGAVYDENEIMRKVRMLSPQIILFDYEMREFRGVKAIRSLKEWDPMVNVIALALQNSPYFKRAVLKAGADAFISKDRIGSALIPTILSLQNKRISRRIQMSEG